MHTLHKRYIGFQRAATYVNVCERVSNEHVTYVNVCVTYMLCMSNVCLTYRSYVGIHWKFYACTKFSVRFDVWQRIPTYTNVW